MLQKAIPVFTKLLEIIIPLNKGFGDDFVVGLSTKAGRNSTGFLVFNAMGFIYLVSKICLTTI